MEGRVYSSLGTAQRSTRSQRTSRCADPRGHNTSRSVGTCDEGLLGAVQGHDTVERPESVSIYDGSCLPAMSSQIPFCLPQLNGVLLLPDDLW